MSSADDALVSRGELLLRYIRAAGHLRGLSQLNEIAAKAGISAQAMRDWATKDAQPNHDTIERVATAVGLSVGEVDRFVYRNGPPPRIIEPLPRRASVVPWRERRIRRQRWLELARDRLGWTRAEATRQVDNREYPQWEDGAGDPEGAEIDRLARVFDLPIWLLDDPPATDAERLTHWHYDSPIELREVV